MRLVEPVPLRSERLELRETSHLDLKRLVELANDYDVAVRLATMPYPYGEADGRWYLETLVPQRTSWSILTDQGFVGVISLKSEPEAQTVGLGYWLGRPFWGRGYATEAGRCVVEYCRGLAGLSMMKSGHYLDNVASGRVLQKLGFEECGRRRLHHALLNADVEHVDMVMSLRPAR